MVNKYSLAEYSAKNNLATIKLRNGHEITPRSYNAGFFVSYTFLSLVCGVCGSQAIKEVLFLSLLKTV
jgi:hypothetical protein